MIVERLGALVKASTISRILVSALWTVPAPIIELFNSSARWDCYILGCPGYRGFGLEFIFLFPPAWALFIILILRSQKGLAWNQFMLSSLGALAVTKVMTWSWSYWFSRAYRGYYGDVGVDLTLILIVAAGIGGVALLYAATHAALLWLPKPFGISGEADWFSFGRRAP
jgi:hypothetical protein